MGVLNGTHGEVHQDGPRNGRPRRAAFRWRTRAAHLRQRLQAGVGAVAGTHEDAAQRIPPAAVEERAPGVHRAADGRLLLWRRRREAQGVRPANAVISASCQSAFGRWFYASRRRTQQRMMIKGMKSWGERIYALAACSSEPSGRKYCVPRIGSLTRRSSACKSSLRSTKSISDVFTISKSEEV